MVFLAIFQKNKERKDRVSSLVAQRGFSLRRFWEVPGFPSSSGKELRNCPHRPRSQSIFPVVAHTENRLCSGRWGQFPTLCKISQLPRPFATIWRHLFPEDPKLTNQRYPQYCWEFHDRLWEALSGTTSEKRGVPSRTGGERILEMLWKPQKPWIIGFGASQPYSRGEFQETLWERFRGLSGTFPEFLPESPSRTRGVAQRIKEIKVGLLN